MLRTIGTALLLAGAALPVMPGTAHAMDDLVVYIGSKGQFIHGALIGIPIVYSCPQGATSPAISMQASQASGKDVVEGLGFEDVLECDGEPKETMMLVLPSNKEHFRRSREVVVDVNISACDGATATCAEAAVGPVLLSFKR
ncbi:hypothetical protein [Polyangium spumosum]|uniref:Uncharacterized protein n=1 Tax=Polyangium spumosum TaxID=889282 RepID=A0A6N7PGA4_9BACT|nr:hypothetical protein [Polyangium spumosum]MRG91142.1 hypothetical protein [Polyangium spumosum]